MAAMVSFGMLRVIGVKRGGRDTFAFTLRSLPRYFGSTSSRVGNSRMRYFVWMWIPFCCIPSYESMCFKPFLDGIAVPFGLV